MAKKTKKTENKLKFSAANIRFIVYLLLVCACIALFLIFGRSPDGIPVSANISPSPAQSPSAVPKGATLALFVQAIDESGMNCDIGDVQSNEDSIFEYPIFLPDKRDGARLILETDVIGRVVEATLELQYIYAGEPDSSYSDVTSSAIKSEYRRREKADCELVNAYLESIYALLGNDCKISTIDSKKILDSVESAYYSHKAYDKKAGSARFYCETNAGKSDTFHFTFRLIASFDYSK